MSNSENVTGPSKGILGVVLVLLLTAGTWIGLWELHQHWYVNPMNPMAPTHSNASAD